MTENYNIFTSAHTFDSDEALERFRHQLSPQEYYYCALHLKTTLDANPHANFTVGSVQRYSTIKLCNVCVDNALFLVQRY